MVVGIVVKITLLLSPGGESSTRRASCHPIVVQTSDSADSYWEIQPAGDGAAEPSTVTPERRSSAQGSLTLFLDVHLLGRSSWLSDWSALDTHWEESHSRAGPLAWKVKSSMVAFTDFLPVQSDNWWAKLTPGNGTGRFCCSFWVKPRSSLAQFYSEEALHVGGNCHVARCVCWGLASSPPATVLMVSPLGWEPHEKRQGKVVGLGTRPHLKSLTLSFLHYNKMLTLKKKAKVSHGFKIIHFIMTVQKPM